MESFSWEDVDRIKQGSSLGSSCRTEAHLRLWTTWCKALDARQSNSLCRMKETKKNLQEKNVSSCVNTISMSIKHEISTKKTNFLELKLNYRRQLSDPEPQACLSDVTELGHWLPRKCIKINWQLLLFAGGSFSLLVKQVSFFFI